MYYIITEYSSCFIVYIVECCVKVGFLIHFVEEMVDKLKIYEEKYGLRRREIEIMYPPKLNYSDTGELVKLLSTLGNLECTKLHIKINEYLWRITKAVPFIIERINLPVCMKIRAIGRVPLQHPLIVKEDCLFLKKTRASKKVERVLRTELEGALVCELENILREEYKSEFQNCFLFPVEHPNQRKTIPYFVALVNAKEFFDSDKIYSGIMSECMRHSFGMISSARNYEEEKMHHEKSRTLLTAYVEIISAMGTDMLYHEIQSQSSDALGASSCSVFLKSSHGKLFMKSSNASYATYEALPRPLTRHVFDTGLPFSSKNPSDEPLYGACDTNVPRDLLAFPICSGNERLGVVEVYDKKTTYLSFDKNDNEMSRYLSQVVGLAIETHDNFEAFVSHKLKLSYADCIFLRRIKAIDDYHAVTKVLTCKLDHKYHRFGDLRFNPNEVPDDHIICFCLKIFEGLGILKLFQVNREKFVRFLLKVKHGYSTLPFHSWPQAFSTLHFTFVLINVLSLIKNKYITPMEAFALLLASLCHSIDSRGSTNMFQMTSGTVLACLFSSPGSVAQMHHASQTLRLMNYPECNFLESLSDEMFHAFGVLLIQMIKDTDFSNFRNNLKAFNTLVCNEYDFDNIRHRRLIHKLIMTCAQMNWICKDWTFCRNTGEHCFQEFYRKGDLSHANGVFEISELNEDILKLPEMNTNFIETICLPTFRVFTSVFPYMYVTVHKIDKNLKLWKAEKEKILATMVQDALGDAPPDEAD